MFTNYPTRPHHLPNQHERRLKRKAAYRAENLERVKIIERAARQRRRSAPGKITRREIRAVHDASDGVCSYCLKPCTKMQLDHCIPISRGGHNSADNCVVACLACNQAKFTQTPLEHLLGWLRITQKY